MSLNPSKLGAWLAFRLDASNLSSLYQDTAATTPVTATGQTIKRANDGGQFGRNATNAGVVATYLAAADDPDGTPSINFAAGAGALQTPSFLSTLTESTIIIVASGGGSSTGQVPISDGTGDNYLIRQGVSNSHIWASTARGNFSYTGYTTGLTIDAQTHTGALRSIFSARADRRRDLLGGVNNYKNLASVGSLGLSGALQIGSYAGGVLPWTGRIKEVLVVSRVLAERELAGVFDDLVAKWAVGSNKPYYLAIGDSIPHGFGVSSGQSFPELLQTALGSGVIVERSTYSGRLGTNMLEEFESDVRWRSWPGACAGKQAAILWMSNDLATFGPGDAEVAELNTREQLYRARLAGFYIIVMTPTPRDESGNTAQYLARRAQWIDWLLEQGDVDQIVRVDLDARIGVAGAQASATYFQSEVNRTHPTAAGHVVLNELLQPAAVDVLDNVTTTASISDTADVLAAIAAMRADIPNAVWNADNEVYAEDLNGMGNLLVRDLSMIIEATDGMSTGTGDFPINHNGGTGVTVDGVASATDIMQFTVGGNGADDVEVVAYLKADYDAGLRANENRQGTTVTGTDGRWVAPLMLDAGTYVILANKDRYVIASLTVVVP